MNTNNLDRWIAILSNIAVLAGIIFLGIELRQNSDFARAQTRSEISRISVENSRMFQDPMNLDIRSKILNDQELSTRELHWLRQAYRSELKSWENIYYQYKMGLFDQPELEAYRVTWQNRFNLCNDLRGGIFDEFYTNFRLSLEPNFREEMDTLRKQSACN